MNVNEKPTSYRARRAYRQRGVGIVTMLLALVVSAALVSVAYNQFTDSRRKARIEAAQSEIASMIAGAQRLYGNANQYGNVTTAIVVRSGVVPGRMRVEGTNTARNRYNGAITFAPASISAANDSLVLSYGAVEREDCQDLAMQMDVLTRRIAVGGVTVKPDDGHVDLASLADACDSNDASVLHFSFGRGQ